MNNKWLININDIRNINNNDDKSGMILIPKK